jgi:hypothetical protein
VTEHDQLIRRYRHLWAISRELHPRLMDQLPHGAFSECGKRLGILRRGILVFDNEAETSVLTDYCLYDYRWGDRTAIDRYVEQAPFPADSDETLVLGAMQQARYTLLAIGRVERGLGIEALDVLYRERVFLVDEGFSMTAVPGLVLASRIKSFPEFYTTTGAALPIADMYTFSSILARMEERWGDIREIDVRDFSEEDKSRLSALVIRCALRRGVSRMVEYTDPGEVSGQDSFPHLGRGFVDDFPSTGLDDLPDPAERVEVVEPIRAKPRIPRNAKCPCGSGRKYKKCCGRNPSAVVSS